jgi:enamine deaminase RidA (YjgF/YER057c/UK114 family)
MPKRVVRPSWYVGPKIVFSPAVVFNRWVFVSGQLASDFEFGLIPEARPDPNLPLHCGDQVMAETRWIYRNLKGLLDEAGSGLEQAIRIDQFPTSKAVIDPYHVVRRELLPEPRPVSTSVVIDDLMFADCTIEVELVAIRPEPGFTKEAVDVGNVRRPLGGYSPVIRVGDFVFIAGQTPTDFVQALAPEAQVDPSFWEGNPIDRQARYILKNLDALLRAAGSSLANVVKAQVYLSDLRDIPRLDVVWREVFPISPPARTIVPVGGFGQAGTRIEVNVVALADGGATRKEPIDVAAARVPRFHEPHAVRAGDLLFLSGLVAADAGGLIEQARVGKNFAGSGPRQQWQYIMEQADLICRAAGARLEDAVRIGVFLTDLREHLAMAGARQATWPESPPASTTVQVPGPLYVPGCTLLVDLWVGLDARG